MIPVNQQSLAEVVAVGPVLFVFSPCFFPVFNFPPLIYSFQRPASPCCGGGGDGQNDYRNDGKKMSRPETTAAMNVEEREGRDRDYYRGL